MKVLIFLAVLALVCWLIWLRIRRNLKNMKESITCYTGTMGSGKTLNCVQDVIGEHNQQVKHWKFKRFFNKKRKVKTYNVDGYNIQVSNDKPEVFSVMPIILRYEKGKPVFSCKLTNDILMLQVAIPEGSTILFDEIGQYANQFEYKNPNIISNLSEFIRLYRHYVNGKIFCNDQSSNFIELHIRKRINIIHNLSNCFVFWRFIFYYDRQITIAEDINTVDTAQNAQKNKADTQDNKNLKFRFMWYKNRYESRYLKLRYLRLPKAKLERYTNLFSMDTIEVPKNKQYIPLTRQPLNIEENNKKGEKDTV